ncbi:hypothetical protein BC938DRAFT_474661 [Jimgerdemannia flammicorona]|uniref:Mid2 domain-containing protein n=1 Tax=Jimgerdemannia flammicorona TaxID=994334 RepID=A0A433Q1S2_9FUNG|nr:hypothetical protein BC938DRAFT_474661 [Jimgerdemannia flammicorona]
MRPLLTALPCLLAIVTAAYAELIAITVTSPAPGLNVPATSAFPIEYTVSNPPLFTTIALSISCDSKVVNANAPVTTGKQSLSYVIPSDTKAGPINLVFTESTYINNTIMGTTSVLSIQLIVPGANTSSAAPPAISTVPPVVASSPTSAPPPTSSALPSSPSATPSPSPTPSSSANSNTRTSVSPSAVGQTTSYIFITSMRPNGTATNSVSPTASEPAASSAPQQTGVIIGSVCGFVAILAAGFGYAFLSKTRKNRRKDRVFGDDDPMPPPAPFDSPRAVGGVIGVPAPAVTTGEERPDSWEPEVTHAPGALYNTTAAAGGYYPQQQYGAYPQQQQQYAAGYYQQQGYQQNPDIQMQNAQGFHQRTGQYPQQYQGQGEYDQQQYGYR